MCGMHECRPHGPVPRVTAFEMHLYALLCVVLWIRQDQATSVRARARTPAARWLAPIRYTIGYGRCSRCNRSSAEPRLASSLPRWLTVCMNTSIALLAIYQAYPFPEPTVLRLPRFDRMQVLGSQRHLKQNANQTAMSGIPRRGSPRTAFVGGRCNKTGQRRNPTAQPHQRHLTIVPMASAAPALTPSGAPVQVSGMHICRACTNAEAGPCPGRAAYYDKSANNCSCTCLRLQPRLLQAYPTTRLQFLVPTSMTDCTAPFLPPPRSPSYIRHPQLLASEVSAQTHLCSCSPAPPVLSPVPALPQAPRPRPNIPHKPNLLHPPRSPPLTPWTCRTRCTASRPT